LTGNAKQKVRSEFIEKGFGRCPAGRAVCYILASLHCAKDVAYIPNAGVQKKKTAAIATAFHTNK